MKNIFGLLAIMVALGPCGALAEAQQAKKVPRIGYLSHSWVETISKTELVPDRQVRSSSNRNSTEVLSMLLNGLSRGSFEEQSAYGFPGVSF
jgi:hypothetical protein